MTEQRICAYEKCSECFTPKRPHQRFHAEPCRYAQWELDKAREAAPGGGQRVEGGVGTRGGNVRSVDEARGLQTASKALDRWRLVMELQIHRTLLETGHFHIDDLDCLGLPAEAFKVRGTLVSSVRRSGVMRSTNIYRKVSHKAANGRPAPIYEITDAGRERLPKLVGGSGEPASGASQLAAASNQNQDPSPTGSSCDAFGGSHVAAGSGGSDNTLVGVSAGEGDPGSSDGPCVHSGENPGAGPTLPRKNSASPPVGAVAGSGSPDNCITTGPSTGGNDQEGAPITSSVAGGDAPSLVQQTADAALAEIDAPDARASLREGIAKLHEAEDKIVSAGRLA